MDESNIIDVLDKLDLDVTTKRVSEDPDISPAGLKVTIQLRIKKGWNNYNTLTEASFIVPTRT